MEKMKFKNVFIVLLIAIFIQQIYSLGLLIHYGFFQEIKPTAYYYYQEIGSLIWYLLLAGTVLAHMYHKGVSISAALNVNLSIFMSSVKDVFKYFGISVLFIIVLSFMQKGTELSLENKTQTLIILSFISVALFAPFFEELAFRGYLYTAMLSKFKRKKERIIVNAMFFSAAHVFLFEFLIGATVPYYIFILGFFLAKLYEEYRSVLPCILLHFLNNALVFGIDFAKVKHIFF